MYTNACSMGNKQEELEAMVQHESYDVVAVTEMWWDESHDWSAAMGGYKLFRKDRQEEVSEDWKKANVSPVIKNGKKDQTVSLTSIPGKMMEHLILETISQNMEDKKTPTWMDEWREEDIVYLNFSKAFDTVSHILIGKLRKRRMGASPALLNFQEMSRKVGGLSTSLKSECLRQNVLRSGPLQPAGAQQLHKHETSKIRNADYLRSKLDNWILNKTTLLKACHQRKYSTRELSSSFQIQELEIDGHLGYSNHEVIEFKISDRQEEKCQQNLNSGHEESRLQAAQAINDRPRGSQCAELNDHDCKKDKLLVDPEIVQDLLLQLNPFKSVGPGGIHLRIIKDLVDVIAKDLLMIF
ncbi:hypothetical protein WISP_80608 [Willisornis vidua]|uniref:Uncharacterized protein n=1 Tax=Willisornis vidua TaxID=1566151 RepID=A0ABQ9DAJ9_9PASS|nr:hypothetical protein WISP_80608 [Willisornis vidua]